MHNDPSALIHNSCAFKDKYIRKEEGLAPSCHFDLLLLLYQEEMGLPPTMKNSAFSNFCQGWKELDQEFSFGHSPHARSELRY